MTPSASRARWSWAPAVLVALVFPGCKKKITAAQCTELIDRYATLVVTERFPDATPEQIEAEQRRERSEARGDDNFRSCVAEITRVEFDCAMAKTKVTDFEKCLE